MNGGRERREGLIAVGVGLAVLGCVLYAIAHLGGRTENRTAEGVIVRREWTARPETQITVGRGGLKARETSGDGVLIVRVPDRDGDGGGREYRVPVDERTFRERALGERFVFRRER